MICSGVRTKVLMFSATPVNNKLLDLRNQIELITEGDDEYLAETDGIPSITQVTHVAQQRLLGALLPEPQPSSVRIIAVDHRAQLHGVNVLHLEGLAGIKREGAKRPAPIVTKRDPRRQRIQGQDERAAPQDENPPKRPARPHRSPSRTRIQLPPNSLSAARGGNSRRTASTKGATCL